MTKGIASKLGKNKKILIFTAFADTAEYLYKHLSTHLLKDHKLHSAIVTGAVVVLPALRQMLGQIDPLGRRLWLPLGVPLPANGPRRHFIRARLDLTATGSVVTPLAETDSGHIASFADAHGLIVMPENHAGLAVGALAEFLPLQD